MSAIQYQSVKRVLARIHSDVAIEGLQEDDMLEWIGEALDDMLAPSDMQNTVSFIEVRDHQCMIPQNLHSIIQIAKNNCYGSVDSVVDTPESDLPEAIETDSKYIVKFPKILDCKGNVLGEYKLAYYTERDYTHLSDFNVWQDSPVQKRCYVPIRLSNHTFFNTVVCKEDNWDDMYSSCTDEYTVQSPYLVFSFREGVIALSYNTLMTDEDGFPMIPDHASYTRALIAYVRYKMTMRMFDQNMRSGNQVGKAESDWHWYVGQARIHSLSLKSVDERENMKNQRSYLLPRQHRYFGFFGGMGHPEVKSFNRSHHSRY